MIIDTGESILKRILDGFQGLDNGLVDNLKILLNRGLWKFGR